MALGRIRVTTGGMQRETKGQFSAFDLKDGLQKKVDLKSIHKYTG